MLPAYTVYILRCSDNSYYTGMTSDIEQRLKEHQEGKYHDCYTYKRRPVKLVWSRKFDNTRDATLWERRIHGWSRKKKEALMEENWGLVQHLAGRRTPFQKETHDGRFETAGPRPSASP